MIYDSGVNAINAQTASLLHVQQQVSTGRRIVTPADDPVNAARALVVSQSVDIAAQFGTNQDNAKSALGLEEAQLSGVNDIMARLKELTVQAGNAALSTSDRQSLAMEMRSRFDELLGIANSADGAGEYMFSGYMSSTKPFSASVDALILSGGEVLYQGDDGQRRLQVSASRFLETSDAGNEIFMRIKNGNGYFTTSYAAANAGTGVIDIGNVNDPATWNALANKNYSIVFASDPSTTPPTMRYDIQDNVGNSLLTGGPGAAPIASQRVYQADQPIVLSQIGPPAFDLGATVTISGDPQAADSFTLGESGNQSLFKTLSTLIGVVEGAGTDPASSAKYSADLGRALNDLDRANDNILKIRSRVGSRLNELETLSSVNGDLGLQYQQTLSALQDLDYAKAISDLTRKQTDLEAAQKSFLAISKMSLFNYI
jgi:flagellar hook-associated protein 3 FlgL